MSKKVAYIFPGQGSQFVGMGKDFYDNFDVSRLVFERANEFLKRNISSICFTGDEENLKNTINAQPCIVATELAILKALQKETKLLPDALAGHSLGEYSALHCANVLDLKDTFIAIHKRAEAMSKVSKGKMAAVITDDLNTVQSCVDSVDGIVSIANYNSLKQVVITGENAPMDKVVELLTEKGIMKIIPLAVSGAFHSQIMYDAAKEFETVIQNITINDTNIPVFTNVDAKPEYFAENFKIKMPKQIYSSVMWTQTVQNMVKDGIDTFVEIGPGRVLTGLIRKTVQNVNLYNIYDISSFENTINEIL